MQKDLIILLETFLKRSFSKKGDGNWVDILPTITKQYNNRVHSSIKLTPIQANLKRNEGYFYQNLLYKRNKIKPKLIESDRGKEYYNNIFQDFLNKNKIKIYSRNSSFGSVFVEKDLIVQSEIFLKNLFLNQELVTGLMYYL